MKKLLFLLLPLLFVAASDTEKNNAAYKCQGKPNPDLFCTLIFQPVCGCDGKTYGNECEARRAGIKKWKEGECKDRKRNPNRD